MYADTADCCDICGKEVRNLTNHVRMSNGDHGPQGRYPEGWSGGNVAIDPSTTPESDESASTGDGPEIELSNDGDQGDQGDRGDLPTVELGDDPEKASNYECGDCGDRLDYHQSECRCGANPLWREQ